LWQNIGSHYVKATSHNNEKQNITRLTLIKDKPTRHFGVELVTDHLTIVTD